MVIRTLALVALGGLLCGTCPAPAPAADRSSIYDTLAVMKNHMILFVAVTEAKEIATLKGDGPYTLFAPTDTAFKKLDDATIKQLASDKTAVKRLLEAHLVKGNHSYAELKKLTGQDLRTLGGTALKIEDTKDGLRVGGGKVIVENVRCSNGVIHVIDVVLPFANP